MPNHCFKMLHNYKIVHKHLIHKFTLANIDISFLTIGNVYPGHLECFREVLAVNILILIYSVFPPNHTKHAHSVLWVLGRVPMDCGPRDSSLHGILQARILEWVAISSSRGSFQPRNPAQVSCIAGRFFTAEPSGKPEHTQNSANNHSENP